MRLVADESCDFAVVVGVRGAGHDVVSIAERMPGVEDGKVIELAASERRLLLTEDKDFGWLAYVAHLDNPGVLLIRFPASVRASLPETINRLVEQMDKKLAGAFVVVRPGSVRISTRP